jgi:hypothetical protein
VKRVSVDLELDDLKLDLKRLENRQPVLERLLTESNLEKMANLKSEEEWRRFRLQVDKDRLIDDTTWDQLKKDTEAESATADVKRQYLFKRFAAMAQADLDELGLKRIYQLKLLEMRGDTDVVREQIERERMQLDHEIEGRRKAFESQQSERERWFAQELGEKRGAAELQFWRVERLETIRQMAKDRDAARRLQEQVTLAEAERKKLQILADMTVGKSAEEIAVSSLLVGGPGGADSRAVADTVAALRGVETAKREAELLRESRDREAALMQRGQNLDHDKFKESVSADQRHRDRRESLDEQEKSRLEGVAVAGLTADDKKRVPWEFCEKHQQKYLAGRQCPICLRERS